MGENTGSFLQGFGMLFRQRATLVAAILQDLEAQGELSVRLLWVDLREHQQQLSGNTFIAHAQSEITRNFTPH